MQSIGRLVAAATGHGFASASQAHAQSGGVQVPLCGYGPRLQAIFLSRCLDMVLKAWSYKVLLIP